MMVGLEYFRIEKNLSCQELAQLAGVPPTCVSSYVNYARQGSGSRGRSHVWLAFSNALTTPVDDLLRSDYPDLIDRTNRLKFREAKTANNSNPITQYKRRHRLSLPELAVRLGKTSRECARLACAADVPSDKHIRALAAYEGISVREFLNTYTN